MAQHARTGWLALIPLLIGLCADQITKVFVVATMAEGEKIPVLPPLLHWHFIRNPGAAFSIGTDYTWIFTVLQTVAAVVVIIMLFKVRSRLWSMALGGLFAGVVGNLIDRLIREPGFGVGHVVDFIALPNFAIFNIADSLIVCSMIGIALLVLTGRRLDGGRDVSPKKTENADPEVTDVQPR